MGAWGCPHEARGQCGRIKGLACDPGMKGCILFGRFVWSVEAKNRPQRPHRQEPKRPPTVAEEDSGETT